MLRIAMNALGFGVIVENDLKEDEEICSLVLRASGLAFVLGYFTGMASVAVGGHILEPFEMRLRARFR